MQPAAGSVHHVADKPEGGGGGGGGLTTMMMVSLCCAMLPVTAKSRVSSMCIPQLLGLLDPLIPGSDLGLVALHELVTLQNSYQLLSLCVTLQQAASSLFNTD